jgi:hypothetical protein
MTNQRKLAYVDEALALLVREFGERRVRAALVRISPFFRTEMSDRTLSKASLKKKQTSTADLIERTRLLDPEKHRLLHTFVEMLTSKRVLPESQDIRQFAQMIGLKEIRGKARRDMVAPLVRFLVQLPTAKLNNYLVRAEEISEQQRRKGFSVLTDKLVGRD